MSGQTVHLPHLHFPFVQELSVTIQHVILHVVGTQTDQIEDTHCVHIRQLSEV